MVTLDLFTKKTRLYYIGLITTIITFSFIAFASIVNLQGKSPLDPLYDTLLILCSLTSVAFVLIAGGGFLRTYIKDGELVLADDYLVIDGVKMPFDEINTINLKVRLRTVKSFILLRNRIEIINKNGGKYERRFVIKSWDQNEEFENVINQWRSGEVAFNISYRNL
jgi:hypothetical protein